MKKNIKIGLKIYHFFIVFIFFLLFFIDSAFAYEAKAPIPGLKYSTEDPSQLISSLYTWGISIVGILAFAQLVRGGIMYMVSGAVGTKETAKGIITDALVGLLLALSSALILNIINPQLADITSPTLEEVPECMTGDEVTSYLNAGYYCEADATLDCSSEENTGGFLCVK